MSEVYIRTDSKTGVVTFVHRRPFDPVHGMGETRDNLAKTGFFVDEFPEPQASLGKKATAYYDHERKKVYYEYELVPFSEKEQLSIIQDMMNEYLMNRMAQPMMAMAMNVEVDEEQYNNPGICKYLAYQIYTGKLIDNEVYADYPQYEKFIKQYLDEWNSIPTTGDPEEEK